MKELAFKKLKKLEKILKGMDKVVLAYSGGVDSTFLLKIALNTLGEGNLLAITAKSPTFPRREVSSAREIASRLGAKHRFILSRELQEENFLRNDRDRCYWCKRELFLKLKGIAKERGFGYIIDGSNLDDLADHRPGMRALEELGVRSPLIEAGFRKQEIRYLSKALKLPTWNKPQLACLASRIAYGVRIDLRILRRIDRIEEFLLNIGFKQVRIRYHGDWVRVEVGREEMGKFFRGNIRGEVVKRLKGLKVKFIVLDLEGYRMGSMNLIGGR